MEWLREQKEQTESAIKMHESCLKSLRQQMGTVCSIIAQIERQQDSPLGGPANQVCNIGEPDGTADGRPAVQTCRRRYSLKEAAQLLGISAGDVRLGMLKNEFIPPVGYVWQSEGGNCYCVSADMLDNYLRVKGMGAQRGKEGK